MEHPSLKNCIIKYNLLVNLRSFLFCYSCHTISSVVLALPDVDSFSIQIAKQFFKYSFPV